jgi:hypothetical protein
MQRFSNIYGCQNWHPDGGFGVGLTGALASLQSLGATPASLSSLASTHKDELL